MLIRCIIKYETKKFFMGKTFYNKWFMIAKNDYSKHFKVGSDFNFFAERSKWFIFNLLTPLNEKEVIEKHNYERSKSSNDGASRNRLTPRMG